jgi:hypothetical protein
MHSFNNFKKIIGWESNKLGWYRDIALSTIASVALGWAAVLFLSGMGPFDFKLGIYSLLLVGLCIALSPNRILIATVAVGFVGIQAWFSVFFSGDVRSWWLAISATVLGLTLRARERTLAERTPSKIKAVSEPFVENSPRH